MKKIFSILCIILFASYISAQIGINTETPISILQIHANATLPTANVSQDVIVSNEGNIGIGGIPGANGKVQIYTTQMGTNPIQLIDGGEGTGRILGSKDNNGNIGWLTPETPFAQIFNIIPAAQTNYANKVAHTIFSWKVPMNGNYLVILRWWGRSDSPSGDGNTISAYFRIDQAGGTGAGTKDNIEYYIPYWVQNSVFSFTITLRGNFVANSTMNLVMTPATPMNLNYNWMIRTNGASKALNPSVIIFKI